MNLHVPLRVACDQWNEWSFGRNKCKRTAFLLMNEWKYDYFVIYLTDIEML
jgi:hypothetical protein